MDCDEEVCRETTPLSGEGFAVDYEAECPPDRTRVGRAGWSLLHTMAAHYPENPDSSTQETFSRFIHSFARVFPCKSCAYHFRKSIAKEPPKVESRESLSNWVCVMHNKVNKVLQKPIFPCDIKSLDNRWLSSKD